MKPETIATLRSWISIVERSDTETLGRIYGVRFDFRGGAYEMRIAGVAGTATRGREAAQESWLRAARKRVARAEEECPGHVGSDADPKVCGRCGAHVDGLRAPDDDPFKGNGSRQLPATGPYVDRLVRIFRDKPVDDGSAVVLQDFGEATLNSAQSEAREEGATHRHRKRGSEYVLIGIGKMQAEDWFDAYPTGDADTVDMRDVAIYRSVDDGSLWVRPREEFDDGRFEALSIAGDVE